MRLQQLELSWSKTESEELLGVPMWVQGAKDLSLSPLLSQAISRESHRKWSCQDMNWDPYRIWALQVTASPASPQCQLLNALYNKRFTHLFESQSYRVRELRSETEREGERWSLTLLILSLVGSARAFQSREPRASLQSPIWWQRPKHLDHFVLLLPGH